MASARVSYMWKAGDQLVCEVHVPGNFPDAAHEARAQAVAMLTDSVAWLTEPEET